VLGRREHSADELRHKLVRRGHSAEIAVETVESLSRNGWQSDERYAEMLVRTRIAQGYGPLRIEAELESVGISGEIIGATIAAAAPDWRALVTAVWSKKFDQAPQGGADWQKQYRFLAGRGFDTSQIRAVLKVDLDE
jgi:regulatory protein